MPSVGSGGRPCTVLSQSPLLGQQGPFSCQEHHRSRCKCVVLASDIPALCRECGPKNWLIQPAGTLAGSCFLLCVRIPLDRTQTNSNVARLSDTALCSEGSARLACSMLSKCSVKLRSTQTLKILRALVHPKEVLECSFQYRRSSRIIGCCPFHRVLPLSVSRLSWPWVSASFLLGNLDILIFVISYNAITKREVAPYAPTLGAFAGRRLTEPVGDSISVTSSAPYCLQLVTPLLFG